MDTADAPRPPLRGRLFVTVQVCYGAFTALGSSGELLVASGSPLVPPDVLALIAVLHASPWVHAWVVLQNLATLPLGLGFVIAGLGLRRGRLWCFGPAGMGHAPTW